MIETGPLAEVVPFENAALVVPDFSPLFSYYDGWLLCFHEGGPLGKNPEYDAVFAAVAASEWRRMCKNRTCTCTCTCTYCVLAQQWLELLKKMMDQLEKTP